MLEGVMCVMSVTGHVCDECNVMCVCTLRPIIRSDVQ